AGSRTRSGEMSASCASDTAPPATNTSTIPAAAMRLDTVAPCDHTGQMKASETVGREKSSASVVQLKARLSEYLRRVKAGNEITVTERGLPIARIVPLDDDQRRATREQRLVRAGVLRPGRPGGVRKSLLG